MVEIVKDLVIAILAGIVVAVVTGRRTEQILAQIRDNTARLNQQLAARFGVEAEVDNRGAPTGEIRELTAHDIARIGSVETAHVTVLPEQEDQG